MKIRLVTLILLYISSVNGQLYPHIIGGAPTSISKFPFQISIRDKDDKHSHECGGAIINEKFVLTAAHCLIESENPILHHYIYAGSPRLDSNGTNYDIEQALYHKKYNNVSRQNDIALLMIKGVFDFNNNVQPVKIICGHLPEGTVVQITGWGNIMHPGLELPDQLYETDVAIVNLTFCKDSFQMFAARVGSKQICTLYKDKRAGTCHGDSGGPISYEGKLLGVISFGLPCVIGKPDVYTRVASYTAWIRKNMGVMCSTSTTPCTEKAKEIDVERVKISHGQ